MLQINLCNVRQFGFIIVELSLCIVNVRKIGINTLNITSRDCGAALMLLFYAQQFVYT